jgi:hypothetical protein
MIVEANARNSEKIIQGKFLSNGLLGRYLFGRIHG